MPLARHRYTEALQLLKNSQDLAWHASVLEGMATLSVVETWTAGQGLVRPILAT